MAADAAASAMARGRRRVEAADLPGARREQLLEEEAGPGDVRAVLEGGVAMSAIGWWWCVRGRAPD